jgi:MFS family permease
MRLISFSFKILGAWLSIKFGSKIVLLFSILIASIFTILTPLAARQGYTVLIITRFIIGLAHVTQIFKIRSN